jgi:YgiT-type zinc finger domain-containing protein
MILKHVNKNTMECVICKNGTTKPGFVTFTLERDSVIIVFKNVPAFVCENCGDFYLTSEITQILLQKANQTLLKGVEFEIINFKTAA